MLRLIGGLLLLVLVIGGGAIALGLLRVEQTHDAKLPQIAVEPGKMPEYKADVAKVEVGTHRETVEVPTIEVKKPD
jgi:hypothetical protein